MPVNEYYFTASEWDRLGCGPLPAERDRERLREQQNQNKRNIVARANQDEGENAVRGYD